MQNIHYYLRLSAIPVLLVFAMLPVHVAEASGKNEETVWIEPYRVPKSAWGGPYMAYRFTFDDGEQLDWVWGIEGFDYYAWGNRYILKVVKEDILNPPTDTPSIRYRFKKQLSIYPPDPDLHFQLPLKTMFDTFVRPISEESGGSADPASSASFTDSFPVRYSLMDEIDIAYGDAIDETALPTALAVSSEVAGLFLFGDASAGTGVVSGIGTGVGRGEKILVLTEILFDFDFDTAIRSYIDVFGDPEDDEIFYLEEHDFIRVFSEYFRR